jgi:hypothetical protein|eukprot:COSAG01_NODE_1463_length_10232_cov_5.501234_9_plen_139_part_00
MMARYDACRCVGAQAEVIPSSQQSRQTTQNGRVVSNSSGMYELWAGTSQEVRDARLRTVPQQQVGRLDGCPPLVRSQTLDFIHNALCLGCLAVIKADAEVVGAKRVPDAGDATAGGLNRNTFGSKCNNARVGCASCCR